MRSAGDLFFFFSLVLPLASMVFFSNLSLGEAKMSPRSRTFQRWNDDLDPEIGRWATWLRKLRRLRWGLGFYQADKSDDDMPKLSVALTSKELTETYWDTCHASVAGETGGRGVHLAWVKTLRWFFAEDSQINWMIDWATLMAAIFPLLQKIGGRRLVATKSAEAR